MRIDRLNLCILVLIVSVSAVIAYGYFNRVDRPNFEVRLERHNEVVDGTALSPYRYRVLVPVVGQVFIRAFTGILSSEAIFPLSYPLYAPHMQAGTQAAKITQVAFLLAYAIYDLLAVFFLLATLLIWLRQWFSKEQALIGVLFIAASMSIALQDHDFQPWSLLEAGLLTASLIAIHQKRDGLVAVLVALASLNRETAVFIPLAFLLIRFDASGLRAKLDWRPILMAAGLLAIWAAIFGGLRYFRGDAPHMATLEQILARNLTRPCLFYTVINTGLFLGGFWVFALLGLKYAPHPVRRAVWIVPPYLITIILWGVWHEVRLLMPLYPILAPLGLAFVYPRQASKDRPPDAGPQPSTSASS